MRREPSTVLRVIASGACLAIACLLFGSSARAGAPSKNDRVCLSSGGAHPVQLEFEWLSDADSDWRGAYVKYRSSKSVIPLVLKSSDSEELAEGRPWEYSEVWVEVLKGEVTGEYALSYQGALINSFVYRNRKSGKSYAFSQDLAATTDDGHCRWQ